MASARGLALLKATEQNNVQEVLELVCQAEGKVVQLSSPGFSCRVRYSFEASTEGDLVAAFEIWLDISQEWTTLSPNILAVVLEKYGPYTATLEEEA